MIPSNLNLDNDECYTTPEGIHENLDELNYAISNSDLDFKILLINIRSINKNFESLQILLNSLTIKPEIIMYRNSYISLPKLF